MQYLRLRRHKRHINGNQPYECDVCQAKFAFEGDLSQHKMRHQDVPVLCGKKSAKHMRS